MDEGNSNLLHYGFSSLDEEIAKDHLDGENVFASGSASLDNSTSGQDGVLRNINPSVILDITPQPGNDGEAPAEQTTEETQSTVTAHPVTDVQKAKQTISRPRKRKAGKALRDENAPKLPQTGYVMYMNERRDDIKNENPNITFSELTKTIACEWSTMDSKRKKKYLDTAEEKKAKYLEELAVYQQTDAFKNFQQKKQQAEADEIPSKVPARDSGASTSGNQAKDSQTNMPGMDLPIFTEEFLEHNKNREKELRELRKLNYQYEEQNAILSKHVDELKSIVTSLDEEANIQRNNNIALVQHLESLRETLATNFVGVPLPETNEVPTVATIDNYMTKLHQIILDAPQENEQLIIAVTEIVNKLNLEAYVT